MITGSERRRAHRQTAAPSTGVAADTTRRSRGIVAVAVTAIACSAALATTIAAASPNVAGPASAYSNADRMVAPPVRIPAVVDGDTVDTDQGRVRIIGYDTPERGECGYEQAARQLTGLVSSGGITMVTDAGDDTDKYGRLLRHVLVDGVPVGLTMIRKGYADARYDALDGYPRHRYQDQYRAADGPNIFTCAATPPVTAPPAAPPAAAEPWNRPVSTGNPDLDCSDIRRKVWVLPPDSHRLDRDKDGWGCESYG